MNIMKDWLCPEYTDSHRITITLRSGPNDHEILVPRTCFESLFKTVFINSTLGVTNSDPFSSKLTQTFFLTVIVLISRGSIQNSCFQGLEENFWRKLSLPFNIIEQTVTEPDLVLYLQTRFYI